MTTHTTSTSDVAANNIADLVKRCKRGDMESSIAPVWCTLCAVNLPRSCFREISQTGDQQCRRHGCNLSTQRDSIHCKICARDLGLQMYDRSTLNGLREEERLHEAVCLTCDPVSLSAYYGQYFKCIQKYGGCGKQILFEEYRVPVQKEIAQKRERQICRTCQCPRCNVCNTLAENPPRGSASRTYYCVACAELLNCKRCKMWKPFTDYNAKHQARIAKIQCKTSLCRFKYLCSDCQAEDER